jgi:choline-sulfatase
MRRPTLILLSVLAVAGLLVCGCGPAPEPDAAGRAAAVEAPPSIVLVSIDTTRADRLGCYGYAGAATPNLDRWAAEGVLFENAATPVPVTLPAHASLLTGLLPNRHGVRDNGVYRLSGGMATLAELLSGRGYDSAAVVGAAVLDREYGLGRGFRVYDDRTAPTGLLAIPERDARAVSDAALAAAAGLKRPFLLFVHYFDPHADYRPPSPFRETFRDRPYDGEIAYVDRELGRLRAGLEARGLLANAVVAIVSDHGEGLGEHGEAAHGVFLYQSTVRVPWILSAPGRLPAGLRWPGFARLTDVTPTLLELAGAPVPAGLDGRSLLGALVGGTPSALEESWLLLESEFAHNSYGWAPLHGITNGARKWIGAPRAELYDLAEDPAENRDLAAAAPGEVDRLARLWRERFTEDRRAPLLGDETDAEEAERLERLESLGYVATARAARAGEGSLPDPKDVIGTLDRINEARRLLSAGDFRSADAILESVLGESPGNVSALILLGSSRIEAGRPLEAVEPLRRAAELAPHKADTQFNLGLALLGSGDAAGAAEAWRRTLRLAPRYEAAAANLVDLLMQTGQDGEAVRLLAEVRGNGLDGPILDYLEGKLAFRRGDREGARRALGRALEGPLPPAIAREARAMLQAAGTGR